ncbi:alpha-ketoglutarate-dependent dioxygenase AlkB family protein [Pseudoalteromonas sp. SS15]|uniref:alpha-ketoglutarate-dependent dioxygenase AlkB family protein n=1 Tax=Pseudoalteromonas sp. SS15 TaxID=3139393 RepID=UPI003BA896FD
MTSKLTKPELPVGFAYFPNLISFQKGLDLYEHLTGDLQWQQPSIQVFGKCHPIPRLQSFVADEGVHYAYSNHTLANQCWTKPLAAMRSKLQSHYNQPFNALLLNWYRDGHDTMGWHSDDEVELGAEPLIISISLGAARKFKIKHKTTGQQWELMLEHGSCLVMSGNSQQLFQHSLPKQSKVKGGRINLTFRSIVK